MLQPKWLLFFFLFFGSAMILGYFLDGVYDPSRLGHASTLESLKSAVSYDYAWISGDLQIFRWVLITIQALCGMLLGFDILTGILRGR